MATRVGMVSLGCPKNQVDAERMLGSLRSEGYELVADAALADVVVVNTCGFIESAKEESIETILEFAKLKEEGRIKKIVVTGCLAERYRDELAAEVPEADVVLGIGRNGEIASVIRDAMEGERVVAFGDKLSLPLSGERVLSTLPFYAYLKIAEGCDNNCTYCAIPAIRGPYRSRPMEELIAEARELAEGGVKELVLVAQDTTRYGEDLFGEGRLPALLTALCAIDGLRWIRVLYCYPERVTEELLQTIAREEKLVKYLDLPIQHVNDAILRRMNRQSDSASLRALLARIREVIPGITLRTTLIAGFPGETEEQFEELSAFVEEQRFDHMGAFAYSEEEGTAAARFTDQVEQEERVRRAEILEEQQAIIQQRKNEALVDGESEVLVEGFDRYGECWFGRTAADAPDIDGKVFFTSVRKPAPGEFVRVRFTDTLDCDLTGEAVE